MIAQSDLAAYWQHEKRHGYKAPAFDVRVNEYDRAGRFMRMHKVYVNAWTHDAAKPAALRWLRTVMYGTKLGRLSAVSVEYSQPVNLTDARCYP